tara:strand:+ start:1294 stop:1926 length:633 start_codon:yes stop_codon:yes gene_type:complete
MENILDSGNLKHLKLGQTLLYKYVKSASNDGGYLEFAEIIPTGGLKPYQLLKSSNLKSKPRRGWSDCDLYEVEELLGIDVPDNWEIDDKGKEFVELNILNPSAMNPETQQIEKFRVQITETTDADEYEHEHWRTKAKKSKQGVYYFHDKKLIFSRSSVVFNKAEHTWLKHDSSLEGLTITQDEYDNIMKGNDKYKEANFDGISENDIFSK